MWVMRLLLSWNSNGWGLFEPSGLKLIFACKKCKHLSLLFISDLFKSPKFYYNVCCFFFCCGNKLLLNLTNVRSAAPEPSPPLPTSIQTVTVISNSPLYLTVIWNLLFLWFYFGVNIVLFWFLLTWRALESFWRSLFSSWQWKVHITDILETLFT